MIEFCVKDAWGVSSLRQCAGFAVKDQDYLYYAPLGCCAVQWNIITKEKTMFQAHNDLMTVMLQSINNTILTISFHGEVKLWTNQMTLLASYNLPTSNIIYGSWSSDGSLFSVCSQGPMQKVIVYDLQTVLHDYKKGVNVKYRWSRAAPQKQNSQTQNTNKEKNYDCFNAGIFKSDGGLLAVYQSTNTCGIYLFSAVGNIIDTVDVSPLSNTRNVMLCCSDIHNDTIVIGLQNGVFVFYNINTLKMETVVQATGSPKICVWSNETLTTISYLSGIVTFWSKTGILLREFTGIYVFLIN